MLLYKGLLLCNYKQIQCAAPAPSIWIWDSKCSNELRVFACLLLMDRLNTRNILKRKKHRLEGNNYNCVLCNNNVEETTFHLFLAALSVRFAGDSWVIGTSQVISSK